MAQKKKIKSFSSDSNTYEFHSVLGQYLTYKRALEVEEPERILYLAIPREVNISFFKIPFITDLIKLFGIRTIIFNEESGDIIQWKG